MTGFLSKLGKIYVDSFSGHPREIWTLFVLFLINRMGTMILPFLTIYLTTVLDFTLKEAGILAGAFGLGSLVGAYVGGKLTDKIGPKFVIFHSLFWSGILFICIQFVVSFWGLFLIIFLAAIFGDAYRPATMSFVGDIADKEQRGKTMALLRVAVNVGTSIGPVVAGLLAVSVGYSWIFNVDGITCILAGIFFIWKMGGNLIKSPTTPEKEEELKSEVEIAPYKNSDYLIFLLASFFMGLAFVQWFNSIPVFIKSEWGFDERYIGIMFAINSIMIFLFELPLINELEKLNKMKFSIIFSLILGIIAFSPFLFDASLTLMLVAIIFFTLGEILFFPFNNAIPLNLTTKSNTGEYMSWYWMTWSLTSILGPLIGLWVADIFGFSMLWISMMALIGISLILNIVYSKRIIR